MKPTINLFFDMEFTSLSPDAQIISLGIVSDETRPCDYPKMYEGRGNVPWGEYQPKSFYAEFTDFDINRCDDWVKNNVVEKLITKRIERLRAKVGKETFISQDDIKPITRREYATNFMFATQDVAVCQDQCKDPTNMKTVRDNPVCWGKTEGLKIVLGYWLAQFANYNIQFVCDCGTFDWYHLLQLVGVWDIKGIQPFEKMDGTTGSFKCKIGLPVLPENISPVPQDLNDLIALKNGIPVRGAFDLNREGMISVTESFDLDLPSQDKHNSLYDAKVIKTIFNKLK